MVQEVRKARRAPRLAGRGAVRAASPARGDTPSGLSCRRSARGAVPSHDELAQAWRRSGDEATSVVVGGRDDGGRGCRCLCDTRSIDRTVERAVRRFYDAIDRAFRGGRIRDARRGLRGNRHTGRGRPADPRRRGRQVQRRDGPHRAARRRWLEPGPLRRPAIRLPERGRQPCRLHRARPRGRGLRTGLPEPRPEGLRLHHRDVVRLHGPDGDRCRGVPRGHFPASDRVQVERQELRQLLRRDGGLQVPRRHAGRVTGQARRQPEDRLHGHLPDPRGAAPRQRDHARRQADVPRVHDGHPLHQHLA